MKCPFCGEPILEQYRFCPRCARLLPKQTEYPQEAPQVFVPEPRKSRLWIPIVIMVLIFAAGFALFLFTRTPQISQDANMPWFSIQKGTLYFDESLYTGGEVLEVPSIVCGQTVTALSENCFQNCNSFVSVNLPDTLKTINSGAFANCSKLRGLSIPDQVTTIGSRTFSLCTALEALAIPSSVTQISSDAFQGCDTLVHIFYAGTEVSWSSLFAGKAGPYTCVYTSDGSFYIGYEPFPFE